LVFSLCGTRIQAKGRATRQESEKVSAPPNSFVLDQTNTTGTGQETIIQLPEPQKPKWADGGLRRCMMPRPFFLMVIATAALLASCGTKSSPLEVPSLLAKASHYNGQIVTLHGCYQNGLEKVVIRTCVDPKPGESIWIVPYSQIEYSEKSISGYRARSTKTDPPTPHEQDLSAELVAMPNGAVSEVVVRGEFQCSEGSPYGHTPGYKYQLILYRVLEANKQ
jgi:hypothetical protein